MNRDEVLDWIYEDYKSNGRQSVIVKWCFDKHAKDFRIQTKRLLREAARNAKRRTELLMFLLDELVDGRRLTGKKRAGVRIEPMLDNESLGVFDGLARRVPRGNKDSRGQRSLRARTKAARSTLSDAQERLRRNPSAVEQLDWDDVVDLCCVMLAADHVPERRNDLETALELCEDVLWPEEKAPWLADGCDAREALMGNELACCFGKVPANERDEALKLVRESALSGDAKETYEAFKALAQAEVETQELVNLGIRKSENGTGHRRKSSIDSELLMAFFDAWLAEHQTDDDGVWDDLPALYQSTCRDSHFKGLIVPAIINSQTGIGVYLMGADRFAPYKKEPNLGKRNVTVAIIDHHLENSLNWENSRREALPSTAGSRKGQPTVMYVPEVEWLDHDVPFEEYFRPKFVQRQLDELKAAYLEQVRLAMIRSFPDAQLVEAAPEDCPERFKKYFKQ